MASSASADLSAELAATLTASFGCIGLGVAVHRARVLTAAQCAGLASLYATLVFPTMLFLGVSTIEFQKSERETIFRPISMASLCCLRRPPLHPSLTWPDRPPAAAVQTSLLLTMAAAKGALATIVVLYAYALLRPVHGERALAHAATLAMAASHSFDVTLGVPLAKVGKCLSS